MEGDNARLRSRDAHERVARSFTWAFKGKRPQSKTENHTLCESAQSKCTQCRRASLLFSALTLPTSSVHAVTSLTSKFPLINHVDSSAGFHWKENYTVKLERRLGHCPRNNEDSEEHIFITLETTIPS